MRSSGILRVEPWWSCAAGDVVTAGVDEAGRGPLAGPVVAAAVVLNPARQLRGLRDSKLLSAAQREILNERIGLHALAVGVGLASVEEIDALNILQATMLAMQRAVLALSLTPHRVLVDGNRLPVLSMACEAIVGGDAKVRAISAASIVAKVHRDRLCADLHRRFPDYGFDVHKGYPTPSHLQALRKHGPCDVHRRSFAPVRAASMSTGWRSSTVGATVQPASTSCAKPAASAPDTGW